MSCTLSRKIYGQGTALFFILSENKPITEIKIARIKMDEEMEGGGEVRLVSI